jgi:Lrp/AsnC family leucine-responsive transcriptional regulator
VTTSRALDEIDHEILRLLREDARRTVKDIASRVKLSAAPVKRRIDRLERQGVITGYTVRLDHSQVGPALEAFTELRYSGHMDKDDIFQILTEAPEVEHVYTMAGDTDALVHLRADDVAHLQRVITRIRSKGNPISTKTLIVMESRPGVRRGPLPE